MKIKLTALTLAAATAFSLAPKTASAGDREWALAGGLIGGLIIGSAIAHHDDCAPAPAPTTVVVDRAVPVEYVEHVSAPCDTGCWRSVNVRVWVPARWVIERDYYGRDCRRYYGGHYENRVNRVWVARGNHWHR